MILMHIVNDNNNKRLRAIGMVANLNRRYGQTLVENTIERLSSFELLQMCRVICPPALALFHYENKQEPGYFHNPETLCKAVCKAWKTGDYAKKHHNLQAKVMEIYSQQQIRFEHMKQELLTNELVLDVINLVLHYLFSAIYFKKK